MTKIIWMSDPHFQHSGTYANHDPRVRLAKAIEHANTHHADADFAILSGDLSGDEMEADYEGLATYLAKSKIPVHVMMGNHDDRAILRRHLHVPADAMSDFVQYALHRPDETIICLDTHKENALSGEFCQARLEWLSETLKQTGDKPAYIFMHHPPLALHLPPLDEAKLEDSEAFLDLISAHSNVKHLFMGHVHRATTGSVRGIPFASIGALSFQAPPPRPAWTWDNFNPVAEAPQYGVLHIQADSLVLQYTQFCDFSEGYTG